MCNPISMLNLSKLSNIQPLMPLYSKATSKPEEVKTLLPRTNNTQMNIKEMAAVINDVQAKNTLPTFEEIKNKFYRGELDPRKMQKKQYKLRGLSGNEETCYVEFAIKVRGRDNNVRIYVGKNRKGEDCVCLDYLRKHEECNIFSMLHIKIPFEKYDKIIQTLAKQKV